MSGTVTLYPATLESLEIQIRTSADPTGTAPQFSFGTALVPGAWVTGAWAGAFQHPYSTALTPTMGATGAMPIVADTTYTLWIKVTVGSEIAEWPVGRVRCP